MLVICADTCAVEVFRAITVTGTAVIAYAAVAVVILVRNTPRAAVGLAILLTFVVLGGVGGIGALGGGVREAGAARQRGVGVGPSLRAVKFGVFVVTVVVTAADSLVEEEKKNV